MGPTFEAFLICHVFWVRWDWVLHWLRARRKTVEPIGTGAPRFTRASVASESAGLQVRRRFPAN